MALPIEQAVEALSFFEPTIKGMLYTVGIVIIGFYSIQYLLLTITSVPSKLKKESLVNSTLGMLYISTFFGAIVGFHYLFLAFTKPFQKV